MKKFIIFLVIIIVIFIVIPKETEEFRIRVIANSDQKEDQQLKMKVVEALLVEIKEYDQQNIVADIKDNLKNIDKVVSGILKTKEYSVSIKDVRFPPKEKDGEIIKGGKYKTLLIVIENGKGKNWWSLLNPNYKYGFEDNGGEEVEFKFFFNK